MTGVGPIVGPATTPFVLVSDLGNNYATFSTIGAADRGQIAPLSVYAPCVVSGIRIKVLTSSGNISVGLYDSAYALLASSGAVACPATGPATIALTASLALAPGRYYLGLSADNNTATFGVSNASGSQPMVSAKYMATAHPLPATFVPAAASGFGMNIAAMVDGGWTV